MSKKKNMSKKLGTTLFYPRAGLGAHRKLASQGDSPSYSFSNGANMNI